MCFSRPLRCSGQMVRAEAYAQFGPTAAQARVANLLHDIYSSVSDGAASSETYDEFFEPESQAQIDADASP